MAPYTAAEVLACVDSLLPAVEIPDTRFEEPEKAGAFQLIADNACDHLLVLGEAAPDDWRQRDLPRHEVVTAINDTNFSHGTGGNVLGNPRVALVWLVNELSALGLSIEPGQIATTGAAVPPSAIAPGDEVMSDFGSLSQVSVRIL